MTMFANPNYSYDYIRWKIETDELSFREEWVRLEGIGELSIPTNFSRIFFLVGQACGIDHTRQRHRVSDYTVRNSVRDFLIERLPMSLRRLEASEVPLRMIDMTQILSAFAMLSVKPDKKWQDYLLKGFSLEVSNLDSRASNKFLRSLREFSIYPGDKWMSGWWQASSELLEGMGDAGINELVYSLAVLDYLRELDGRESGPSPCREIATMILDIHEEHFDSFFPDLVLKQQIYDAAIWFGHRLLDAPFVEQTSYCIQGPSEQIYRANFSRKGTAVRDYLIKEMNHKVDMSFDFHAAVGSLHLFEVDGKYHFNFDMGGGALCYNGETMFRTALMEKVLSGQGATVLRLPDYPLREFNKVGLASIVANVQACMPSLPPGTYVMHGIDNFVPADKKEAWVVPMLRYEDMCRPV